MSVLGKRLKQARNDAGLKQIDAAKRLGISNGTLSGYERNYRDPDTEILNDMANLYEVSTDWLLGKSAAVQTDNEIDQEIQELMEDMNVWYKDEPEDKEVKLRMLRKMFEAFKED